eukprot:11184053-Lingulodinium_polyedra.AAC.1
MAPIVASSFRGSSSVGSEFVVCQRLRLMLRRPPRTRPRPRVPAQLRALLRIGVLPGSWRSWCTLPRSSLFATAK